VRALRVGWWPVCGQTFRLHSMGKQIPVALLHEIVFSSNMTFICILPSVVPQFLCILVFAVISRK
jgi:hypothetical protein